MTDEKRAHAPGVKSRFSVFGLFVVITLTTTIGLLSWWACTLTDQEMRADLLKQTRSVARSLNADIVKKLSGTPADLDTPDYKNLKDLLSGICSADTQCRFLYLMGRKADRTVFFFADSEPSDSKECSPAGQVYKNASADLHRVFDSTTQVVEGPISDFWGTWVSALVPIIDPQTGHVIAVLGEDVDASVWKWDLAAKMALPMALMLLLAIILGTRVLAARHSDRGPARVRGLLLPLTMMIVLMMVGTGALLLWRADQNLNKMIATDIDDVSGDMRVAMDLEKIGLNAAAKTISFDSATKRALIAGDADSLLNAWRPVFDILKKENDITHLYFFDKNRVCLMRVHKPDKRGDRIDRFTALEAERTGKPASGLELGPLGILTLRVVQPVFENGALVGYVELGKELDGILTKLNLRSSCRLVVLVSKEHLNRKGWEEGRHLLGKEALWDLLPRSVVFFGSAGGVSNALLNKFDNDLVTGSARSPERLKISDEGRIWGAAKSPLNDASGKKIGELVALRDITLDQAALKRVLILSGAAGAVLLMFLLSFLYVLLVRTERSIFGQQAKMLLLAKLMSAGKAGVGVADEMSQPLTAMSVYLESLRVDPALRANELLAAKVAKIKDQFSRIETITREMQNYVESRPEDFFLDDVNRPTLAGYNAMKQQIKSKNIVVHLKLTKGLPKVLMNLIQIQEVVSSLLTDASDALKERFGGESGGEMTLFSKELKSSRAVLVGVIDNGNPVKKGVEEIMLPFATKGSGPGSSLGLIAGQGVLQDHGGIRAFSWLSKERKIFYFMLPSEKCPALSEEDVRLGEDIKELFHSL